MFNIISRILWILVFVYSLANNGRIPSALAGSLGLTLLLDVFIKEDKPESE